MVEKFSIDKLKPELSQILSQISNMYFNVVEDQVQEIASVAIGKCLARLAETRAGDQTGIKFMNGAIEDTEVSEFISRCVNDIISSPESMQAGLSSVVLKQIAISSVNLQTIVTKDVLLKLTDSIVKEDAPIISQVAYLTVITGLLEAAASCNTFKPMVALTLEDQ